MPSINMYPQPNNPAMPTMPTGNRTLFQLNGYDKPFPRNPQVVEELERDGMLQEPAPLPWREAELEYLRRALDLKGEGLVPRDQR